jgi:hypothetical protein
MKYFINRNKKLSDNIKKLEELELKNKELISNANLILSIAEEKEKKLIEKELELRSEINLKEQNLKSKERGLERIFQEKSMAFPWLSEAIAEYYRYIDFELAEYLDTKSHPAYKKAELIREIALNNKQLRQQLKITTNFVAYYENLFPWLSEYVGENLDDLIAAIKNEKDDEEYDPVLKFMPKSEYDSLSESERNQKALDRYMASRKKPWEIGRDYERYIGYIYEQKGYKVEYQGIEKGLEDLGRDLICTNNEKILVIQCKYWASHKTIHEKHINQLFGTAVKYFLDYKSSSKNNQILNLFPDSILKGEIRAIFITSTKLSNTAKSFAEVLGIEVIEEKALEKYPIIKCNISNDGSKIYHLPFDQMYDKTLIKNKNEFYAFSVNEAEEKGFRRAFRWSGQNN